MVKKTYAGKLNKPDGLGHKAGVKSEEGGVKEAGDVSRHFLGLLQTGLDLLCKHRCVWQLIIVCNLHITNKCRQARRHEGGTEGQCPPETNETLRNKNLLFLL